MKTASIACALMVMVAGCAQKEQEANAVPMKDQPRPSSTPQQIIEDMTGKTDVKAGQRAMATIERVREKEKQDYEEVTQ